MRIEKKLACAWLAAVLLYGYPALLGEKQGTDWMYRDVVYDIEPTSLEGKRVPPEDEPLVSEQIRGDRGIINLQFQNAEPEIWRLDCGGEEYLLAPETGMLFLPDWEEREEPCLHLTDVQKPYIGLSMLGVIGEGESLYYVQAREHHRLSLWGAVHTPLTLFPTPTHWNTGNLISGRVRFHRSRRASIWPFMNGCGRKQKYEKKCSASKKAWKRSLF